MYAPGKFEMSDLNEIQQFLSFHPFGMVVSNGYDGFPVVSHLPFVPKYTAGEITLEMHLALENEHVGLLKTGATAKLVVQGAHGYVSSSVYTHENVPTYNYQAVHLVGMIEVMDAIQLSNHLVELVNQFEAGREVPLSYADFSEAMISSYKAEIVGVRLRVIKAKGIYKLSQNRNEVDFERILDDLNQRSMEDQKLATAMKKVKCPHQ